LIRKHRQLSVEPSGFNPLELSTAELVQQRVRYPFRFADHMRAHFADGPPIADSENPTVKNRVANQSILLVGCLDFIHVRVRLPKVHGPPQWPCTRPVPRFTFGIPYFGLISWQPSSQNTPPSADSGRRHGRVQPQSRASASITRSTSEINSAFSFRTQPTFFLSPDSSRSGRWGRASSRSRNIGLGTYAAASWMAWPFMRIILASIMVGAFAAVGAVDGFRGRRRRPGRRQLPSTITPGDCRIRWRAPARSLQRYCIF